MFDFAHFLSEFKTLKTKSINLSMEIYLHDLSKGKMDVQDLLNKLRGIQEERLGEFKELILISYCEKGILFLFQFSFYNIAHLTHR